MINHCQIFKGNRSICDWQCAKSVDDLTGACARLIDNCMKNGSFKSEHKDPEQPFGSEMLTFKKD